MVTELYFKEKFAEDGLYPAPKGCLADAVSEHFKPVALLEAGAWGYNSR